jgi:hypothetical protein
VYDFCRRHRGKIIPSFGRDKIAQPFTWFSQEYYPGGKKPIPGGFKAVNVNTKFFKDELARLLEISPGDPSAWRYHAEFPEAYAVNMTADHVNEKGLWECPKHKPNHLWDCAVLNLVVHEILGIKFWKQKKKTVEKEQNDYPPETTIPPKQIKYERPNWLKR